MLFKNRILWHILFWILCYLLFVLSYGGYWGYYYEEAMINLKLLPVRVIGTYSLIYFLMPVFLFRRRYYTFTILTLIHAFLFGFLIWATMYYFCDYPYYYNFREHDLFYFPKILTSIISNYIIAVFAATVKLFKKWYLDQQYNRKLEKEKLEAELKYLKSQIHPHFLFNTLNNLYALTLNKSDIAPDIVVKLSELLDYMLYNSNEEEVPLEKELHILKGYVELEKIRYDERLDLSYSVKGDTSNKRIAPLILLPFVENSFKHGASIDTKKPVIVIDVKIEEHCFYFHVANSIPSGKSSVEKYTEGIGLNNVRRRLDLIYHDRYKLSITPGQDLFEVTLTISWTETPDDSNEK